MMCVVMYDMKEDHLPHLLAYRTGRKVSKCKHKLGTGQSEE
jgi:hypothetical protein